MFLLARISSEDLFYDQKSNLKITFQCMHHIFSTHNDIIVDNKQTKYLVFLKQFLSHKESMGKSLIRSLSVQI